MEIYIYFVVRKISYLYIKIYFIWKDFYLRRNKNKPSNKSPRNFGDVIIERLGAKGDGVCKLNSGETCYVPHSAPGDHLRISYKAPRSKYFRGLIDEIIEPGDVRIPPVCQHFRYCGGCALQHLSPNAVAAFKRSALQDALAYKNLNNISIQDTISIPPGTRRRVEFAIDKQKHAVSLGFNAAMSRKVIDIAECAVALPSIVELLTPLRELISTNEAAVKANDIRITETDNGFDFLILAMPNSTPGPLLYQRFANFAAEHNISRISWTDGEYVEPIVQLKQPKLRFGRAVVALPERYFLQPSREGEIKIVDLVRKGVKDAKRIADLYAGCGTLSFPLAETAQATAFEIDGKMVSAMRRAAAGLSHTAERRDLARNPLTDKELRKFDAVIFDPPRSGAQAQAEYLAASEVPTIVAVSCNPTTLARDLRILVDGGYLVQSVVPIDQFAWSVETEAVAILRHSSSF